MTHIELVTRAGAWLKRMGCSMVFTEMVTLQSETPDAIGWRNSGSESFMVECKASRSDFFADKYKAHRNGITFGMGRYRYYFCQAGLLKPEEMPPRWGLLYCHPTRVEIVKGKDPRRYDANAGDFAHEPNLIGELRMMHSALSRLRIDMGQETFNARIHLPYAQRKQERDRAILQPESTA